MLKDDGRNTGSSVARDSVFDVIDNNIGIRDASGISA